ncbi:hypothetical protein NK8_63440 (plasmid) [Caballeronia sp. NK8]|uniref:SAVED domain-containing protein n=1 Tax=Caballeronia sp. NK8 TaxID=140098 RepID=UPI001BB50A27|nr:hypothetical protein NK8_63440 [Caballeronia sp. NK8]
MDDAHEALWGAGLRSNDAKPARYFYPGGQHHDVHSAAYWTSLFQQMKLDLPMLQTLLNGTRAGVSRPRLSVFPMHSTSVLLLAGRVLGDTEGTHLFQPHRNKVGAGTRWAWPVTHARRRGRGSGDVSHPFETAPAMDFAPPSPLSIL